MSSSEGIVLLEHGQIPKIPMPDGSYPISFVDWAETCFSHVLVLIEKYKPSVLVVEETTGGSKTSHSQKILEWIHFCLAKYIKESKIRVTYILTGQWRSEVGAKMTKEESKHNKTVKEYKKTHNDTQIAYNEEGKRIGKITKKHVAIRRANEVFGHFFKEPLRKKDEDLADSLMLAYCYHLRRMKKYAPDID